MRPSVSKIINALATPRASDGRLTENKTGALVSPAEIYIYRFPCWIREDGSRVSGWFVQRTGFMAGNVYYAYRPNIINRWRLRRACQKWSPKP